MTTMKVSTSPLCSPRDASAVPASSVILFVSANHLLPLSRFADADDPRPDDYQFPAPSAAGPSGLLAQLMGGSGMGMGFGGMGHFARAPPPQ